MTTLRVNRPEDAPKRDSDPADDQWSKSEMLLAAAIDELRKLSWLYVTAHSKDGRGPRPPEPLPRPGVLRDSKPRMTVAQYKALTGEAPPERLISE